MTDPIADLLIRIKNAYLAKKLDAGIPYSRVKEDIVKVLTQYQLVNHYSVEGKGKEKKILIELKYDERGAPTIEEIRRISKPGRRQYAGSARIKTIRGGFGLLIISTNQGIMSGAQAKEKKLGGELMAEIW